MKDFVAGEGLSGMDNVLFTRPHLIDTVFYSGLKCYIGGILLGNIDIALSRCCCLELIYYLM